MKVQEWRAPAGGRLWASRREDGVVVVGLIRDWRGMGETTLGVWSKQDGVRERLRGHGVPPHDVDAMLQWWADLTGVTPRAGSGAETYEVVAATPECEHRKADVYDGRQTCADCGEAMFRPGDVVTSTRTGLVYRVEPWPVADGVDEELERAGKVLLRGARGPMFSWPVDRLVLGGDPEAME